MSRLKRGATGADTGRMAPRFQGAAVDESGFSIIEMVVAMTIAALMLMGGAHVLGSSLKTVVFARSNTQSAELISERIEQLRAADYAALAMVSTDLTGDSAIGGTALAPTFDPDGDGPLPAENVVTASTGSVNPHITTATRNDQPYTLATYVTQPVDTVDAQAIYKRLTVRATWTTGGLTHTRQSSTFVTITRRGLPLPNFQVIATNTTSPIVVNAGAPLTLPFNVVNRGARDGFNLTVASTPSLTMTYAISHDVDPVGVADAGDTAASDSDVDDTPDTGQMESDETMPFVAVGNVPATAIAGSYVFTVTGTSIGQPTAGGATRSATFDVTIVNDSSCGGCTYTAMYLRNEYPPCVTAPCDTTARTDMPLRSEAPTATALANFDTDVDTLAGRAVAPALSTPGATSTTSATMANWRFTMEKSTNLSGDLLIDLHVAVPTAGTSPEEAVRLKAYVSKSTSGSGATSLIGSATHQLATLSTGYQAVRIVVPVASTTIANNRFLEVKVVLDVDSPTPSTNAVSLAYDATGYAAVVWAPVV